jgi:hypothetical protein
VPASSSRASGGLLLIGGLPFQLLELLFNEAMTPVNRHVHHLAVGHVEGFREEE